MTELKALQESADKNRALYAYNEPNAGLLERFPRPPGAGALTVNIVTDEFSSLCPLTGQPDFAQIVIDYEPDQYCVESKALKLYLMGFRQHGSFHESVISRICSDLVKLLDPKWIHVKGNFTPRGGIAFIPTASWSK